MLVARWYVVVVLFTPLGIATCIALSLTGPMAKKLRFRLHLH